MTKHFLLIVSKMKFLVPLYLIIFHCSLPIDPAEFAPQNLNYDKKIYFQYVGDELKAVASVEYAVDSFTIDPPHRACRKYDQQRYYHRDRQLYKSQPVDSKLLCQVRSDHDRQ